MTRCPACGATNPDSASFCGQCLTRFEAAAPTPAAAPAGTATSARTPWAGGAEPPLPVFDDDLQPQVAAGVAAAAGAHGGAAPAERRPAEVGRFSAGEGGVRWTCGVCGERNPVAEFTCEVCGSRMDASEDERANVDWDAARTRELMLPGLGLLHAGVGGGGGARVFLAVLWLLGALGLAFQGLGGLLGAFPLLVGLAVLWLVGPGDLQAAKDGREARLTPRRLLYLVAGVTMGVMLMGGLGSTL